MVVLVGKCSFPEEHLTNCHHAPSGHWTANHALPPVILIAPGHKATMLARRSSIRHGESFEATGAQCHVEKMKVARQAAVMVVVVVDEVRTDHRCPWSLVCTGRLKCVSVGHVPNLNHSIIQSLIK